MTSGFAGVLGNKGAVACRFQLRERSMCFVSVHLPAGSDSLDAQAREAALADTLNALTAKFGRRSAPGRVTALEARSGEATSIVASNSTIPATDLIATVTATSSRPGELGSYLPGVSDVNLVSSHSAKNL